MYRCFLKVNCQTNKSSDYQVINLISLEYSFLFPTKFPMYSFAFFSEVSYRIFYLILPLSVLSEKEIMQWSLALCMLSQYSPVWPFATLWTVDCQAPLSMKFSRQEYWSKLPCTPPEDLPDPRDWTPMSLTSPAFSGRFFITSTTGKPYIYIYTQLL